MSLKSTNSDELYTLDNVHLVEQCIMNPKSPLREWTNCRIEYRCNGDEYSTMEGTIYFPPGAEGIDAVLIAIMNRLEPSYVIDFMERYIASKGG